MNTQVTEYITSAGKQKEIMETVRQLIHASVQNVTEEFKWGRPVFRATKDFAYLKSAKAYVTLGFFKFDKLEDKHNLLEGTGKNIRHIKLKSVADIDQELLAAWFKSASS